MDDKTTEDNTQRCKSVDAYLRVLHPRGAFDNKYLPVDVGLRVAHPKGTPGHNNNNGDDVHVNSHGDNHDNR